MKHKQSEIKQEQIDWRRDKVLDLSSKGHTEREIAKTLQVCCATVHRDIEQLRRQAKANISRFIDDKLPLEYQKCMVGLDAILKKTWEMSNNDTAMEREKLQAMSVGMQAYSMKIDLLTNATVVERAVQFVGRNRGFMHQNAGVCIDDTTEPQ
jgi:hypothetical protein